MGLSLLSGIGMSSSTWDGCPVCPVSSFSSPQEDGLDMLQGLK